MSDKRSKYDTDPLEPDFARNAEEGWGAQRVVPRPTEEMGGATRDVGRTPNEQARQHADAEAPTRRIDHAIPESYPSIFVPPTYQPPAYQPPPPPQQMPAHTQPAAPFVPPMSQRGASSKSVNGIGLPEKWACALPYAPFYIGIVVGIIELLTVPRNEVRTRFHAAQGLALQLAILVISYLFTFIRIFGGGGFGGWLFWLVSFVFLIVSMIRVFKGEEHRLAPLNDATKWLNEKLDPRK